MPKHAPRRTAIAPPARIRNIVARYVLRDLGEAGYRPEPLLRAAGLQMAQVNRSDGWLSYAAHGRLLNLTARELGDRFYGVQLARRLDPRDLGALAYVGLSSRSLRDALLNLERYMRVENEAWSLGLVVENRSAILTLDPAEDGVHDYEQAAEHFAASLVFGYQFFVSESLAPRTVRFVHGRPADKSQARYEALFGCPVEFSRNRAEIVIDQEALRHPIGTADDRLLHVLQSYCEQVLKRHAPDRSELVGRIQHAIVDLLASGRAKANVVASELGMTTRTMHRRLAEEGTSFSDIQDRLRQQLAERYIRDKSLSLQQIAFLLGYADQSAFSVAFRRWTGRSPKEARAGAAPSRQP